MLDWKVTEESNTPLPDEPIEYENERRPMSRQWLYILVATAVVAFATIGGFLWGRLREGERVLEQDLLVQIRAEETARRFGQTNRINVLIPDNVPQRWRERYASHFRTPIGEAEAVEVAIEKLELAGEQATVWVRMDEQVQRRAYRMTAGGWRRVPLGTGWAGNKTSRDVALPQGTITVNYFETDREFATELIADLPVLLETIEQWRSNPITLRSISIQPQELEPGVIEVYFQGDAWVTLNSPEVVQLPAHWNLSGAAAVRYALAERLLSNEPILLAEPEPLPGASRFVGAVDKVLALQWALYPDAYAALVTEWQQRTPEIAWRSPFFAIEVPVIPVDPFTDEAESATALLVADVFITHANTTNLPHSLNTLDSIADWDTFFETTTGFTTQQLEDMAGAPAPTTLRLPIKVTPFAIEQRNSSSGMIAVRPMEQRHPIAIDGLENATFTLPDGTEWEAECASLFGEMEINGVWREEGLRLTASNITIPRVTYPARFLSTPSPPPDTVAYLGSGSEMVMPAGDGMNSIVALTSTGERVAMLMNGDPHPFSLISNQWVYSNSDEGMLIRLQGIHTGCYGDWLLRFVPGVGITGAWLYRTEGVNTTNAIPLWDDTSGRGILIFQNLTGEREMPFWWLEEGHPQVLGEPDGMLPFGEVRALRPGATHIAIHNQNNPNREPPVLSLIDLSDATDPIHYSPDNTNVYLAGITFSPEGHYLYLGWTDDRIVENSGDGTQMRRIDLRDGTSEEMWERNNGVIYALFRDKTDAPLYAVANEPETGFQLVKIDENEIVPLAKNQQGSEISYVQTCGGGGVYYLTLEYEGDRPNYQEDTRILHIVSSDATGMNQDTAYPLRAWEFPVLCP
jgi:hypothetical protein